MRFVISFVIIGGMAVVLAILAEQLASIPIHDSAKQLEHHLR